VASELLKDFSSDRDKVTLQGEEIFLRGGEGEGRALNGRECRRAEGDGGGVPF